MKWMRFKTGARVAFLLFLSGCTSIVGLDAVSIMGTDKSIVDHAVSLSSGKNCSSLRLEQGRYYCEEDTTEIRTQVYCYNTLGRPTCYDRPDPTRPVSEKLGQNDHNLPTPK